MYFRLSSAYLPIPLTPQLFLKGNHDDLFFLGGRVAIAGGC